MEYNLREHGDSIERVYSDLIYKYFRTYEDVWKLYIGNKGNDTKADIPGYSKEREEKRQNFSEHTYTILQSVVLLHRLITNEKFASLQFSVLEEFLDLQDNLLLFFTHLGRIRDNVESASTCLLHAKTKETTSILDEFYHKRHILVHGKTLPIVFRNSGEIFVPTLSKNGTDISGWNHKEHKWEDISHMPQESLEITVTQLYWELLAKLIEVFGIFKKEIDEELNNENLKLIFDRTNEGVFSGRSGVSGSHGSSGNAGSCGADVYGLADKKPHV